MTISNQFSITPIQSSFPLENTNPNHFGAANVRKWRQLSDIVDFHFLNSILLFLDGRSVISMLRAATTQQCGLSRKKYSLVFTVVNWKIWRDRHLLKWLNETKRPIREIFSYPDLATRWDIVITRFFRVFGTKITSLNLEGFTDAIHRFEILRQCPNVVHLNLRNCNIGYLRIGFCKFYHQNHIPEIASLPLFKKLETLDIDENRIEGSTWLKYADQLNNLKKLTLYKNNLSNKELKEIAASLAANPSLYDSFVTNLPGGWARSSIMEKFGFMERDPRILNWMKANKSECITQILKDNEIPTFLGKVGLQIEFLNIENYRNFTSNSLEMISLCLNLKELRLPSLDPNILTTMTLTTRFLKLEAITFANGWTLIQMSTIDALTNVCPNLISLHLRNDLNTQVSEESWNRLVAILPKWKKLNSVEGLPPLCDELLATRIGLLRLPLIEYLVHRCTIDLVLKSAEDKTEKELLDWTDAWKVYWINRSFVKPINELNDSKDLLPFLDRSGKKIKNLNLCGFKEFGISNDSSSEPLGISILRRCPYLSHLNLSECGINSQIAQQIAQLDTLGDLEHIELQMNEIRDKGLQPLITILARMSELKFVDLRGNGIEKLRQEAKRKIRIKELLI